LPICLLDDHQIGQSEQGAQLRGVLEKAAITQPLMPEQVLDDVEWMLDPGPYLRQRPLDRLGPIPQSFGQRFDDAALDGDVPVDIAVRKFWPLLRSGVAGIGKDRLLLAVQDR